LEGEQVKENAADVRRRFWAKVAIGNDCWEWTGYRNRLRGGYGIFGVDHKTVGAHRYAWEQKCGPIPDGLFVLHACDNPPCVRPGHLSLGTPADNSRDMVTKRRNLTGERDPKHKLTEAQVRELKDRRGCASSYKLAVEYDVAPSTIRSIWNGYNWKTVA
jgi:hypothetical protein